ncbi:hypothetical protein [Brevibacillus centrosporus]|uniref:hypothetical protein n=1 Tax=Brevibacillus centrosporus TaxID=54910 RepID=UPI003B015F36
MEKLLQLFRKSNAEFLKRDSELIASGVSERCLCGALMLFLHNTIQKSPFKDYYADVEYNRNDKRIKTIIDDQEYIIPITCDLIVHSRGSIFNQDNLIAIEMKKSSASFREKLKDKIRLKALTRDTFDNMWPYDGKTYPQHVCGYLLGVYYEINIRSRFIDLEYYERGEIVTTERIRF